MNKVDKIAALVLCVMAALVTAMTLADKIAGQLGFGFVSGLGFGILTYVTTRGVVKTSDLNADKIIVQKD